MDIDTQIPDIQQRAASRLVSKQRPDAEASRKIFSVLVDKVKATTLVLKKNALVVLEKLQNTQLPGKLSSIMKGMKLRRTRSRRKGRKSKRSGGSGSLRKVKLIRLFAIFSLVGVVGSVIAFFAMFAWYSRDLPEPGQVVRREGFSTKVFDRDGELLYDLFGDERRDPVSINDIPEHLKKATISIEDKDFYSHVGFDILTPFRIGYNFIFRGRVIGGSTLTQQLVKNALLTNERSIQRKFKELVLSLQIERTFTKDQILEMYLTEAPYGGASRGVGTASKMYFDKPVEDLTLVESAILAGLPQRPSAYSPYGGKTDKEGTPLWKSRTLGVLRRMREDGYLTDLSHEEALAELETVEFNRERFSIKAPQFVFYVKGKLVEQYGEDLVENGGLQVTTTLDLELHNQAQEIVAQEVEDVSHLNVTNGAAMVMDPKTGEILSMVGSVDYFSEEIDGQFNVAADGLRQPGSSIKPVTYLGMLQRGFTPASILMDVQTEFSPNDDVEKPYIPNNYDGQFRGPVSLRNSLGSSLNIPAVKSLATVGIDSFLNLANSMGFGTLAPTEENFKRFGLALTLGGGEVHLIDTVTAYSAFANGGTRIEPVSILKVTDHEGNVIFEHQKAEGPQVMTAGEAFLINDILSDDSARVLAFGAGSLLNTGKHIAVKTGTTNDLKDNWTVGWSQEVMVGSWVGNNDGSPMKNVASGVTGASPIWRKIINAALELGYAAPAWEKPDDIEEVELDIISGYPSHDDFEKRKEFVIKGSLPSGPDPIHTKLKICKGDGKLATDAKIAAGDYDEKEFVVLKEEDPVSQDGRNRWQEAINAWIDGQEDGKYKPPTEYCGESGDIFVKLVDPAHEKKYDSEDIKIKIESDSGDGVEKVELYVNGEVRETVNNRNYEGTIKLSAGRYELYAKAYSRSGKETTSSKIKIGTGGQDWKEPEPTPSPTPSPSPDPTPTPSPSPSLTPTPSPSPSSSP